MSSNCSNDHTSLTSKYCPLCGMEAKTEIIQCFNGHHMTVNQKFCSLCGVERSNSSKKCPNNHEVKTGAKFCNLCGESIKDISNPEMKVISNNNSNRFRDKTIDYSASQSKLEIKNLVPTPVNIEDSFSIPQDSAPKSSFSSNKNFLVAGISGLLLLLFGIIFVGSISSSNSPVMITVEMTLVDEFDCFDVSWGYADIPGGQVVLEVDGIEYFGTYGAYGTYTGTGCKFTALISGVKSDGTNYAIGMASGRRGTIYSSRDDLMANDWTFSLSLG